MSNFVDFDIAAAAAVENENPSPTNSIVVPFEEENTMERDSD